MKMVQSLTLDDAKLIADGAEEKAMELGVKIAIAIMDDHGNLKYYRRMDGNNVVSVRMSQLKAMTSSSIPISTKALAERNAALENKPYLAVPGIVLLEGGLPIITKEGQHVGSIGVSGANPEIDGRCAQAGLEKIREQLKLI
jgi:glc operon protein GlcG